jgi:hypothetical protein
MFQRRLTVSQTNPLEQVFVDSQFGLFQAGIKLTNFSIYLYENSRETFTKNRHSFQYQINFQDIIDIRLRDPHEFQEEVFRLPKSSQLLADPCFQKKTCHVLRIFFREIKAQRGKFLLIKFSIELKSILFVDCDILTNADSCIHRQIISHWQSALQIDSLALRNEIAESQYTAAHQYYMETLSSLKVASESKNVREQTEILREFGTEIISDVTLKQICFSSRELIVILFSLCDLVVSAPEIQTTPIKSHYNLQHILETQILQRLELFHAILHVSLPPLSFLMCLMQL